MNLLPVSIIFVTHNRKELLCKAIRAAQSQTIPVEIIVMDDASNDGTAEMILHCFPEVNYNRSAVRRGPSCQRNEGAKMAKSDIIVFLDDDTIVDHNSIVKTIINDFTHDSVGAVAIPFVNVLQSNAVYTSAPDNAETYVCHAFIAAAFAIRRSVFLKLGGFREAYFYMGEEGDLCIRLLDAGYFVKAGTCQPAFHFQPLNRISFRADFYGRRNDILFVFLNTPRLFFVLNLLGSVTKGIWFGIRVRRLTNMLKGLVAGIRLLFDKEIRAMVKPVNKAVFFKYRYLKRHEPLSLNQFNNLFG